MIAQVAGGRFQDVGVRVSFFVSMPTMVHQRKPLGLREARIIWRMKHVLKLPVTKIAVALERNKTSAYRALGPNFKP